MLIATLANQWRGKDDEVVTIDDVTPRWADEEEPEPKPVDQEQAIANSVALVELLNERFGGLDLRARREP